MHASHYILAAFLIVNIASADTPRPKILDADVSHEAEIDADCETQLTDSHHLLVTQCDSVNASISTERGDSILIDSKGTGNSIVIRMGSTEGALDEHESNSDSSIRKKRSVSEEIQRLLKRRDLSPEAIQRHIDRIKERESKNTNKRPACKKDQICIDVNSEYPIDEIELETSK